MPEISDERLDEMSAWLDRYLSDLSRNPNRFAEEILELEQVTTLIAEVKAARAGKGVGETLVVPLTPTAEMLRAGMDDLGWWVEPYTAPRESGVPVDNDMSPADAASINATQMAVIEGLYSAMLAAAPALPSFEPQGAQEAVAWRYAVDDVEFDFTEDPKAAERYASNGIPVDPLYASPTGNSEHGGVRVKALEWRQLTSPREDSPADLIAEWEADCVIGTYIIKDDGVEWWLHLSDLFDTRQLGRSNDPDALRRVAQADYESRILSALEPAVAALTAASVQQPTHRHKKRGSEYVLIGYGKMQAEGWSVGYGEEGSIPADMHEVAVYRSVDDGSLWVRPREEFEDGRFEALKDNTHEA